jgi:hypothetical protein
MLLERVRRWAADWADFLALAAFGCAIFLLLGMFMPNWLARTSWSRANRRNDFLSVIDSPASYVGLVSLCGLVAFVFLAIGLWRHSALAAVLAAAAFAYAAYVEGNFWQGLSQGVVLLDGSPTPEMGPPRWMVHWPPLLPFFFVAAVFGTLSALALAVAWLRRPGGT